MLAKRRPHLVSDGHEEVVENLQHDRIDLSVPTASCRARGTAVRAQKQRLPPATHSACQPASRILVPVGSVRMAGPVNACARCTGLSGRSPAHRAPYRLTTSASAWEVTDVLPVSGRVTVSPVAPIASAVRTSIKNCRVFRNEAEPLQMCSLKRLCHFGHRTQTALQVFAARRQGEYAPS